MKAIYRKTILPNGLKVITEKLPHVRSVSIGIWVNVGGRNEGPKQCGLTHFIEHMVFKGTKNRTARQIAETFDGIGGQLNAFTEKEQTCYYSRVVDTYLPLAIEVMADMIQNSLFGPEDMERERGVILEEINMYEDSPEEMVFDLFYKSMLNTHPLGRPILGNKKVIAKVSRDDILSFMHAYYAYDNIIICAAGNVSHRSLVSLVKKHFKSLSQKAVKNDRGKPQVEPRATVKYRPCEQVYLCMGGKGISQTSKDKYKFFVMDSILGGSMSSRLFQEIREERGLVYTVSSFIGSYRDCGLFGIYAGTNVQNTKEVISLIRQILKDLNENGVSKEEIVRAKEHIKGNIYLAMESTSTRMIRLVKTELFHGRLIPPEEIIERIDKVTRADVKKMARKYLDPEIIQPVILGPVKRSSLRGVI